MAKQSTKSLVIEFMDRFFDNKGKASKFFDLEDVRDIITLSNDEVKITDDDAEFILNLVSFGMMAGYMKGYKQAFADQKKGINELNKPLKYAKKKDIMPSDITGAILAKKLEKAENSGGKKAEKKSPSRKAIEKKPIKKTATKTTKK